MKIPVTDITNCDREAIHIPGNIQGHGFMAAIDKKNFTVQYVSENIIKLSGCKASAVLGKTLDEFLEVTNSKLQKILLSQLISYASDTIFENINPAAIVINGIPYDLIIHENNICLLIEFEPRQTDIETELQRVIGYSLSKILDGKPLLQMLQNAAQQVKEIIGYDRIMIYKFWEDGHGEVIAEAKNDNLEPFLHLHYPASDIPKQARELYKINLTRIIADVHMPTSAIVAMSDVAAQPLDLTYSTLRAVSPMHIEYLKNMGVAASFSVSLIAHGELWGLIACHNYTPRFIEFKAREGAKLIGQLLSSALEYRDGEESKEYNKLYQQAADDIISIMQKDMEVADALLKNPLLLLQVTGAGGAAFVFENTTYKIGKTPADEQLAAMIKWLNENMTSQLFHTDNLSSFYKPATAFAGTASGILACRLSKEMKEYIVWFKPEIAKTVNWAGNPNKNIETNETGAVKISPRHSFAIWRQQVENTSEKWSSAELTTVIKLREDIIHIINQKANQIRKLNEKLKEAYDELDTFSFTISHDLKTPITSIKNYAEIILKKNETLDETTIGFLHRIGRSADKMNTLINEVLAYSRINTKELVNEQIDMQSLIKEISEELKNAYKSDHTSVVIKNTPDIKADKIMVTQIFTNIIGNAIKYSSKRQEAFIEIDAGQNEHEIIYSIKDNGVGINVNFGDQVFDTFKRMDNVQQFEGSGVGLSIVKRMMQKNNAKVWYESELNVGTTFYLSFSNYQS